MAAASKTASEPRKGPSLIVQIGVLLALSAAVIGGGWFAGQSMGSHPTTDAPAPAHADGEAAAPALNIVPLATIMTNLADPRDIWVRLELALVFEDRADPRMAELVHQDLIAYMRTVKSQQIEGPSGFQHLKSDLEERARTRSLGKVSQVLIRTLLFE